MGYYKLSGSADNPTYTYVSTEDTGQAESSTYGGSSSGGGGSSGSTGGGGTSSGGGGSSYSGGGIPAFTDQQIRDQAGTSSGGSSGGSSSPPPNPISGPAAPHDYSSGGGSSGGDHVTPSNDHETGDTTTHRLKPGAGSDPMANNTERVPGPTEREKSGGYTTLSGSYRNPRRTYHPPGENNRQPSPNGPQRSGGGSSGGGSSSGGASRGGSNPAGGASPPPKRPSPAAKRRALSNNSYVERGILSPSDFSYVKDVQPDVTGDQPGYKLNEQGRRKLVAREIRRSHGKEISQFNPATDISKVTTGGYEASAGLDLGGRGTFGVAFNESAQTTLQKRAKNRAARDIQKQLNDALGGAAPDITGSDLVRKGDQYRLGPSTKSAIKQAERQQAIDKINEQLGGRGLQQGRDYFVTSSSGQVNAIPLGGPSAAGKMARAQQLAHERNVPSSSFYSKMVPASNYVEVAKSNLDTKVDQAYGIDLSPGTDYTVSRGKNDKGQTVLTPELTKTGAKKVSDQERYGGPAWFQTSKTDQQIAGELFGHGGLLTQQQEANVSENVRKTYSQFDLSGPTENATRDVLGNRTVAGLSITKMARGAGKIPADLAVLPQLGELAGESTIEAGLNWGNVVEKHGAAQTLWSARANIETALGDVVQSEAHRARTHPGEFVGELVAGAVLVEGVGKLGEVGAAAARGARVGAEAATAEGADTLMASDVASVPGRAASVLRDKVPEVRLENNPNAGLVKVEPMLGQQIRAGARSRAARLLEASSPTDLGRPLPTDLGVTGLGERASTSASRILAGGPTDLGRPLSTDLGVESMSERFIASGRRATEFGRPLPPTIGERGLSERAIGLGRGPTDLGRPLSTDLGVPGLAERAAARAPTHPEGRTDLGHSLLRDQAPTLTGRTDLGLPLTSDLGTEGPGSRLLSGLRSMKGGAQQLDARLGFEVESLRYNLRNPTLRVMPFRPSRFDAGGLGLDGEGWGAGSAGEAAGGSALGGGESNAGGGGFVEADVTNPRTGSSSIMRFKSPLESGSPLDVAPLSESGPLSFEGLGWGGRAAGAGLSLFDESAKAPKSAPGPSVTTRSTSIVGGLSSTGATDIAPVDIASSEERSRTRGPPIVDLFSPTVETTSDVTAQVLEPVDVVDQVVEGVPGTDTIGGRPPAALPDHSKPPHSPFSTKKRKGWSRNLYRELRNPFTGE